MKLKMAYLGAWIAISGLFWIFAPLQVARPQGGEPSVSREEEVGKLLTVIRDARLRETSPEIVFHAIKRLGDLKAVEATDDLAGLLTFRKWMPWEKDPTQPKDEVGITSNRERYPAALALLQICPPALPALVRVLEAHEPASLEAKNAMEVLIPLSRYDRPNYVQKLKDAAAEAASSEAKQRLLEAAKNLKETRR